MSNNNIPKKSKISDVSDFKISRMKPRIKATNPHKHDEYHELIYLTKGAGFHTIDMQEYEVETPCLFLVKSGEVHFWEFTEVPSGFVVIFKSGFLAHLATRATFTSFNQIEDRYFPLAKSNKFPFETLFELIETEFSVNQESSNQVIGSTLGLVFTQLFRLSKGENLKNRNRNEEIFNQFLELLGEHVEQYNLVKEYAELLHITPKFLNKISKKQTGKTASKLITQKQVLESQRQLLYSTKTVSEIADVLGFSSSSHFVTFFKRHTELTPDQYRRKNSPNM